MVKENLGLNVKNSDAPKTTTVPKAGKTYYGLGKNSSYEAAKRGDIPTIRIGRLLRVPIAAMEAKLAAAANIAPFQQIGDAAERVAESCGADVRDHNIKMQAQLNRQKGRGNE